jgi:hypothetical protein
MMFQVITKIVDYELKPGQIYEGVWHVEGMSHEEIVLKALYMLERDESIPGGDLTFKRAFFRDEAEVIFSGVPQMRSNLQEKHISEGLAKLVCRLFHSCLVHKYYLLKLAPSITQGESGDPTGKINRFP